MSASISLRLDIGPMVHININGANCKEVCEALEGYRHLNKMLDEMCSDLAERVYPQGSEGHGEGEKEGHDEL